MTFSPTESSRLSAVFAEAHEQATPGEWKPNHGSWASNVVAGDRVIAECARADAVPIATFRNNAASASAQLAAAVERVAELEREASTMHRGYRDLHDMLPGNADVWSKVDELQKQRDSLRTRLAAVMAMANELAEIADESMHADDRTFDFGSAVQRIKEIRAELAKGTP